MKWSPDGAAVRSSFLWILSDEIPLSPTTYSILLLPVPLESDSFVTVSSSVASNSLPGHLSETSVGEL